MATPVQFSLLAFVFVLFFVVSGVTSYHCFTCVGDESVSENERLPQGSPGYYQNRRNMKGCLDDFSFVQRIPTCSEEDVQNVVGTVCVKEVYESGWRKHVRRRCAMSCEPPPMNLNLNGYWLKHYSCCWGHYCNAGVTIATRPWTVVAFFVTISVIVSKLNHL